MFEMSDVQKQAFVHGTGGASATSFCTLILWSIGVVATLWFLFYLIGVWHRLQTHHIDLGEAFGSMGAGLMVYVFLAALIIIR